MSYKSQVALSLSHDLKNEILAKAKTRLTVNEYVIIQAMLTGKDTDYFFENEHGILVYFEKAQWHHHYPEIRLIEEFFSNESNQSNFMFLRIGDDTDDVENVGKFNKVKPMTLDICIRIID